MFYAIYYNLVNFWVCINGKFSMYYAKVIVITIKHILLIHTCFVFHSEKSPKYIGKYITCGWDVTFVSKFI